MNRQQYVTDDRTGNFSVEFTDDSVCLNKLISWRHNIDLD